MKRLTEKSLYPIVQKWLKRHYRCFATAINKGIKYSRIDVVGVRDVGGDLSGEVESIIIEVKRGTAPFATACGQALGYQVYANKIYLADYRNSPFLYDEIHIASHLGIGLIQINRNKCFEILSSPHYRPITKLNLALMENLGYGWCQICSSMFKIGDQQNKFAYLARENLKKALEKKKGIIFWNQEIANRKKNLGIRDAGEGLTYEHRFICPDCIDFLFRQFKLQKEI